MVEEDSPGTKETHFAPWIVTIIILCVVLVFGFGTEPINAELEKLWGRDLQRAVRILSRLWFYSTPAGALIGVVLAYLILRSSWLTQAAIFFLRVGRWAPFLIWWVLAAALTAAPNQVLPRSWFWAFGGVTVALSACYEFLAARFVIRLSFRAALASAIRAAIIQGIFIALVLDMSVWVELWIVYPGKTPIGYVVFFLLAAITLLINWVSGCTFDRAAVGRGAVLINELKYENWSSFLGASVLALSCLVLWQALTSSVFSTSPIEVLKELWTLLASEDFIREILVSLGEVLVGVMLSGGVAMSLFFVLNRIGGVKSIADGLLLASQVAPIALLPDILGFFEIREHKWSTMRVSVFCFYSFARAFWGLRNETIFPRTLLAVDEALPYGAAGIVYGEGMNATGGLGFMMVVAGATFQTAKGLAVFLTLLFLVMALSIVLRWLAKKIHSSALSG